MVQQALHKGLFLTRLRTQSAGDSNAGNEEVKITNDEQQEWSTVASKKRPLNSPEKTQNQHKQSKMDHYWLSNPISTSNSFSQLEESEETQEDQCQQPKQKQTEKSPRPPPIFVDKVGNIQPLVNLLNEHAKDKYDLKVLRNDQVKIQPKTAETYTELVKQLEQRQTEFYTYKPKQERSYKVVLKNMHPSTSLQEIKEELSELGHSVTNIWNIKARTTKKPLPIFFIELKPNNNNKEIYEIKNLLHCQVKIEEPRPKREIPQCAKCQQYGHTKTYCRRQPKCIKCAGNHISSECSRKEKSDDVKCVLCEGNHPANYKGCVVYQDLLKTKYPALRQKPHQSENRLPQPKLITRSYAHAVSENTHDPKLSHNGNTSNDIKENKELKEIMAVIQQVMQQLSTITNLLVTMTSKLANSIQSN